MRTLLKVACAAYVLVLIGTTVAFFVQRHVTYHDRIRADPRSADEPVRAIVVPVVLSDGSPSGVGGEVDIRFIFGPETCPRVPSRCPPRSPTDGAIMPYALHEPARRNKVQAFVP